MTVFVLHLSNIQTFFGKIRLSLRLFCAWHNVRLILAVVKLCCCAQFLIFLPLGELLHLRQVARNLVAVQCAFDLKQQIQ